jgi:hypothetical protein
VGEDFKMKSRGKAKMGEHSQESSVRKTFRNQALPATGEADSLLGISQSKPNCALHSVLGIWGKKEAISGRKCP